jgi:hypothetical protein
LARETTLLNNEIIGYKAGSEARNKKSQNRRSILRKRKIIIPFNYPIKGRSNYHTGVRSQSGQRVTGLCEG